MTPEESKEKRWQEVRAEFDRALCLLLVERDQAVAQCRHLQAENAALRRERNEALPRGEPDE